MNNRINLKGMSLLLLLVVSAMAKAQTYQPYKSGIIAYHGYSFPIVPGTDAWKSINHTQRVASLQLPADTLQSISTERLLETCLYYPFNIDIFALDDQIYSFNRVKEQFNGYAELYQRTDFVQQLMNLYSSRNVAFVNQMEIDREQGHYAFDYHIMEFMFTDAAPLASDTQAAQIAAMLYNKQRAKDPIQRLWQHQPHGDCPCHWALFAAHQCFFRLPRHDATGVFAKRKTSQCQ